jgi:choline kinase
MVNSVIILAAGQNIGSDGYPNILIKHPITRKTILEHAVEAFKGKKVTVVVGYKALQIIEHFPKVNFVLNNRWALTKNSMSLGLALSHEPTYVMSGDIFVGRELVERLDSLAGNLALTAYNENRSLSAIHCVLRSGGVIDSTYQGPIQTPDHPEAVGLYKVSTPKVLSSWKSRCLKHTNLHAGQLLPCTSEDIFSENLNQDDEFHEVNGAVDYLELVQKLAQND